MVHRARNLNRESRTLNEYTQQLIAEFRANKGQVSGPFEDSRMLLLTTTGRRSGDPHTAFLGYYPDAGRLLVVGSAGGGPKHPDWYHNLVANPMVTVEDGVFTYEAKATVLRGADRDRVFARLVEADPGWGDYQAKTTRTIPVVSLEPTTGGPPEAKSFGEVLRLIHGVFRRELALIRKEVATAGPRLGAQLRINCLTLCQGLHGHHTHESAGMFPSLLERHPEHRAAIERLQAEHDNIAVLLEELQTLISTETTDPAALLTQVDRLITDLIQHLDYEEDQLIPLLDA